MLLKMKAKCSGFLLSRYIVALLIINEFSRCVSAFGDNGEEKNVAVESVARETRGGFADHPDRSERKTVVLPEEISQSPSESEQKVSNAKLSFPSAEQGLLGEPSAAALTPAGCSADDEQLPRVPKCCDLHESYLAGNKCSASDDYFFPVFVDCPDSTEYYKKISLEKRYKYSIGDPCMRNKYILDVLEFPEDEHYLYSNGTLWYGNRFLSKEEFCVESINNTPRIFVCFDDVEKAEYKFVLYPIGLLVSLPLLLLTGIVYLGLKNLRDVQGKALACHVLCLAVAYFFLSLVQLASQELNSDVCIAAAFIIHFFFVACFFWLNVLCFDTWRNIRCDYRLSPTRETAKKGKMKFIYYSLYAWYGPSILSIVSLVMDLEPAIPESYLKPKFGVQSCWFESDEAALPYFYGPVGVLIAINLLFFMLSAREIYREQRKYMRLKRASVPTFNSEMKMPSKLRIYIKALKRYIYLFCVMGINWTAEIISWIIGGSDVIWAITDIFNTLQGLIIFYIFVIKPRYVREEVIQKLQPCFRFSKCCSGDRIEMGKKRQYFENEPESLALKHPKAANFRFIDASVSSIIES